MEPKITVAIPVGPKPHHKQWLGECIESILKQTELPKEILIVSDMANIDTVDAIFRMAPDGSRVSGRNEVWIHHDPTSQTYLPAYQSHSLTLPDNRWLRISEYTNPWLLGVVASFNIGVKVAVSEWVLQLGSDDTLHPYAIESAQEAINQIGDPCGLYNFSCQMMDTGEVVNWFNHANVVSKALWNKTGGLHPMTVTGGMDAALVSIMMVHMPQHLHKIKEGIGLYQVRQHEGQYTRESASRYGTFMVQLRNDLTAEWKEPEWTKTR